MLVKSIMNDAESKEDISSLDSASFIILFIQCIHIMYTLCK